MSYEREAEPMNVDEVEVVDADDVDEITIDGVKPIGAEDDEGARPSSIDEDKDDEGAGPSSAADDNEVFLFQRNMKILARGVKRTGSDDDGEGLKKKKSSDSKPFCNGQCALCVTPRGSFTGEEGEVDVEEGEVDPSAWSFYA